MPRSRASRKPGEESVSQVPEGVPVPSGGITDLQRKSISSFVFRLSSSRHQEVLPYPLCPWFDRASARSSTFCTDLTDAPAFRQVRHLFQQLWKSDEERILPSLGRHPLHFIDLWPPMSPSLPPSLPPLLRKGQGYSTLSSLIFRHKCRLLSDVLR